MDTDQMTNDEWRMAKNGPIRCLSFDIRNLPSAICHSPIRVAIRTAVHKSFGAMHFIPLAQVRHGLHGLTLIQSVKFREIRVSRERQGNQVHSPKKFSQAAQIFFSGARTFLSAATLPTMLLPMLGPIPARRLLRTRMSARRFG